MRHIEDNIQRACVRLLRVSKILVFAIPNGGTRNAREAHNLKLSGVLAGVSDLIIVLPQRVVFVEMKTTTGRQQPSQKDFQKQIETLGFEYLIWRSVDDCIKFINDLKG